MNNLRPLPFFGIYGKRDCSFLEIKMDRFSFETSATLAPPNVHRRIDTRRASSINISLFIRGVAVGRGGTHTGGEKPGNIWNLSRKKEYVSCV